jgi:uncharacterized protein
MACPLIRLRKILVATDGSIYSEAALLDAMRLASACATKLYILSVIETNIEFESMALNQMDALEGECGKILNAAKEQAVKNGIDCEVISRRIDDTAIAIVDEAKSLGVDMIVMGKHGAKRGLKKLLMGSVTEKVIGEAPCSVLVVKA